MGATLKKNRALTAMEIPVMLLLLMVAMTSTSVSAQQVQTCAAKLTTCANYLNSTNPPESCCGPLRDALTNDLPCLCSIFNNPEILKAFHVDPKIATQLPKHCGMPSFSTTNACANNTAGPSASTSPGTSGGNNNTAMSTTWLRLSGLMSFFLFWWSIMA